MTTNIATIKYSYILMIRLVIFTHSPSICSTKKKANAGFIHIAFE